MHWRHGPERASRTFPLSFLVVFLLFSLRIKFPREARRLNLKCGRRTSDIRNCGEHIGLTRLNPPIGLGVHKTVTDETETWCEHQSFPTDYIIHCKNPKLKISQFSSLMSSWSWLPEVLLSHLTVSRNPLPCFCLV